MQQWFYRATMSGDAPLNENGNGDDDMSIFATLDNTGNITFANDLAGWNLYAPGSPVTLIGPAAGQTVDVSSETLLAKSASDAQAVWDGSGSITNSVFDLNWDSVGSAYNIPLFIPTAGSGSSNQINFINNCKITITGIDRFEMKATSLTTLSDPLFQVVWNE